MKILNVGCGGVRPADPRWTNLDNLKDQFRPGTPERRQIDSEQNYVEHNIFKGQMPLLGNTFTGCTMSHVLEHFSPQDGLKLLADCKRILSPGGVILISVPDASYFRQVDAEDRNENWPRLFDVTDPKNPIPTWREAALFFDQHAMVFTEDSLWCFLRQAGFGQITAYPEKLVTNTGNESLNAMGAQLNRIPFSLVMSAVRE